MALKRRTRRATIELLDTREMLTSLATTLIQSGGIRNLTNAIAIGDNGMLIEDWSRHSYEVHYTNGTDTVALDRIVPFEDFIDIPAANAVAVGDYFVYLPPVDAPDDGGPVAGSARHVTDGTADGTIALSELEADTLTEHQIVSAFTATGTPFFEVNDRLYFTTASDAPTIWWTDGSEGEANRVVDYDLNTQIAALGAVKDQLVFSTKSAAGTNIWSTNGSGAATILATADADLILDFHQTGQFGFFHVGDNLYRTDGSVAGTSIVDAQELEIVDSTNTFLLVRNADEYFAMDEASTALTPIPLPSAEMRFLVATEDAVYFEQRNEVDLSNDPSSRGTQTRHQFWKTYGTNEGEGFVAEWWSPPIFDGGSPATQGAWYLNDHVVFLSKYQSFDFAPDFTITAGFEDDDLVAHAGGELKFEVENLQAANHRREYDLESGEDLLLDASGTVHRPGLNVAYAWDLDGDGEFDDATGPNLVLSSDKVLQYSKGHPFEIVLQVSDGEATSTDRVTVNYPRFAADANEDGRVDFQDFLVLSANYGKRDDVDWQQGDFDGDGRVGFSDFLLLQENFGRIV